MPIRTRFVLALSLAIGVAFPKDCFPRSGAAQENVFTVSFYRENGLIIVPCWINNKKFRLILDSSASDVCLKSDLAFKVGLQRETTLGTADQQERGSPPPVRKKIEVGLSTKGRGRRICLAEVLPRESPA